MKQRRGTGSEIGIRLFLPWILLAWALPGSAQPRRPAAPHYDVVALRVEFAPDTTRYTTGDGTFAGVFYPDGIEPRIDPLPHDAAYFEAHLAFLEDYVLTVSDGRTEITTHLLPETVRLPGEMGSYSPTGLESDSDEERRKLVRLIRQAWERASAHSTFDASGLKAERTAFVIFHAGAGRDIELGGTSLDRTPLDLPSVFFGADDLRHLGAENLAFKSLPVTQTAVLPRTESRPGVNLLTDEVVLLELSINGLLAASFFNFLGVPDLFNTETGESAIGPYGLMDAEGIFAYAGLFPPEPSPWTRQFLGWIEPLELTGPGPRDVSLAAAGLKGTDVARIPISEAEYFLVENRHRDPEGDGLVLRVWKRGVVTEQIVPAITDDFNRFAVPGFSGGVVVGVDNYDFALPGRDADGIEYDGGALVWHVDERVIRSGIASGRVNADAGRRGVDLEEADSAQDIGFGNYRGSPFDFFWEGNPVGVRLSTGRGLEFYENRFGPDTVPDSRTNEGGESFVTVEGFSAPAPVMTFTYRLRGAHGIEPGQSNELHPAWPVGPGSSAGEGNGFTYVHHAATSGSGRLYVARHGGGPIESVGTSTRPVVTEDGLAVIDYDGALGRFVYREYRIVPGNPIAFDREVALPYGSPTLRPFLVRDGDPETVWAFLPGEADNSLVRISSDGRVAEVPTADIGTGIALLSARGTREVPRLVTVGRRGAVAFDDLTWSYAIGPDEEVGSPVFGKDAHGFWGAVPLPDRGELLFLHPDGSAQAVSARAYGSGRLAASPAMADVNADGTLEIVTTLGLSLLAFTRGGALAPGFPVALEAATAASPLVVEISGSPSVIVAAENGEVYAFDAARGTPLPGFPLAAGARVDATPVVRGNRLHVVTTAGNLRSWTLTEAGNVLWGEHRGDALNSGYAESAASTPPPQAGQELLVDDETYNWPNPIRSGQTFLRLMTREDASIRIRIVDLAGGFIDEIRFEAPGGAAVEHEWNTQAASGLYYARVTATTTDGRIATKLVKMAVIR